MIVQAKKELNSKYTEAYTTNFGHNEFNKLIKRELANALAEELLKHIRIYIDEDYLTETNRYMVKLNVNEIPYTNLDGTEIKNI